MRRIFLLLLLFFLLTFFNVALAEEVCPFGLENDPAPGNCIRFIDTNGDDFCDLSQIPLESNVFKKDKDKIQYLSEEELKQKTVKEVAEVYGIETSAYRTALSKFLKVEIKGGDNLLDLHDNNGLCSGVAANIALSLKNNQSPEAISEHDLISGEEIKQKKVYEVAELYDINQNEFANKISDHLGVNIKLTEKIEFYHDNYGLEAHYVKELAKSLVQDTKIVSEPVNKSVRYKIIPIAVVLLILYLITYILVKEKKISFLTLKRIWNVVLLISFLASAVLALLLIIRINWGWFLPLPFNMLYWHVEFGTIMFVVIIFHLTWHWRFYTRIIKRKNKE